MKAWKVFCSDKWCSVVHADTKGKAIVQVRKWVDNWNEFIEFHALRLPGLDDKEITYENCLDAGFYYLDSDGEPLSKEKFTNDCHCYLCRSKSNILTASDLLGIR